MAGITSLRRLFRHTAASQRKGAYPMTSAAQKLSTRELTLAALFVAVVAVLSQIVVPMPLVPFNLALD